MFKTPIDKAQFIEREFSKYIKSTFVLSNEKYNKDLHKELDKATLSKGPFLKIDLPFLKGKTINELIGEEILSRRFKLLNDIKPDRKLYSHQEKSIRESLRDENIVLTTGTGSGKTEGFLFPIINDMFKKIDQGETLEGIHTLILYPMNALVNDQLDRLRNLLKNTPEITFGHFTGDTKHNYGKRNKRDDFINENYHGDEIKPPINEMITREEIRNNPPNILITNFSMLEYLQIRPKDKRILNSETLKNWQYMVLDEAHFYRGTLATEVSHLLLRLKAFSNRKPKFILTSATLGTESKDKQEIIRFANDLTSNRFSESGIIFAERIVPNRKDIKHVVELDDYLYLENNLDNYNHLLSKYNVDTLFDLVKGDRNIHDLFSYANKTSTYEEVYIKMKSFNQDLNDEKFSALIFIATSVYDKDNSPIYDIKYHMFIRTLQGAFVTLGEDPKLRITNRKKIDDLHAVEIGACRNCNTIYLMGQEENNILNHPRFEIYENYSGEKTNIIDFYLLEEDYLKLDEEGMDNTEKHIFCSKCGNIFKPSKSDAHKCSCGNNYLVNIYKVHSKSTMTNNLTSCVSCNKSSRKFGMINSFTLGKDQSTALLSQIILRSMTEADEKKEVPTNLNLFEKRKVQEKPKKIKQFLAFSDSRQQASFYALFFQNMQDKFLRKRLVYKNSNEEKSIDSLITSIENDIYLNKLFSANEDNLSETQQAYISVLLELFKADGVNSLEGLGLLSFELELKRLKEVLSKEEIEENLSPIKYEHFDSIVHIFTDIFRISPAIDYEGSGLNYDLKEKYLEYRKFDVNVFLRKERSSIHQYDRSLLSVDYGRFNNYESYMSKVYSLNKDEIIKLSEKIWNLLTYESVGIIKNGKNGSAKIPFSNYKVVNKDGSTWYRCNKCHTITKHNINDSCVKGACDGRLKHIDVDKDLIDNYYRNEYLTREIEDIVAEEHTGQLTREKGKEYQNKFKNKEINVLSSSTTFEMGVDLGTLDTIFMRNMPPTNANYAQRAGRAGRSDKSVAFILTYANQRSHDQIYFNNPIPMIEGRINPPIFKLNNEKITIRHIFAHLISIFYRTTNLDDTLETFINTGNKEFTNFILNNKEKLEEEIIKILNIQSINTFNNYKWVNLIISEDKSLDNFTNQIIDEIESIKERIKYFKENGIYNQINNLTEELNKLLQSPIVEVFSRYNIIPGYSFPIDVVPLKIFDYFRSKFDIGKSINRPLTQAISEYAPDSEIIADKKKYTSRYIILPNKGEIPQKYYYTCINDNCGMVHVSDIKLDEYICSRCNNETDEGEFIIPNLGFINDEHNKKSEQLRPRKTYASEIVYLGEPFLNEGLSENYIEVKQSFNDKLLLVNDNPFFYCNTCGYSELNKEKRFLNSYEHVHHSHLNRRKECHNKILTKTSLGYILTTDVIKLKINDILLLDDALSTLTALINGITSELQIDDNDINGTLSRENNGFTFIIYDTTFGGSGNVNQLNNKKTLERIIKTSLESVSNECCSIETSCTNCLRNYRNDRYHDKLKRGGAKRVLENILLNQKF